MLRCKESFKVHVMNPRKVSLAEALPEMKLYM